MKEEMSMKIIDTRKLMIKLIELNKDCSVVGLTIDEIDELAKEHNLYF